MNRPRIKPEHKGLPARVNIKYGRYYYVTSNKWHKLSRVSEGLAAMHAALAALFAGPPPSSFEAVLARYLESDVFKRFTPDVQKQNHYLYKKIGKGFAAFRVEQVKRKDVYEFLTLNAREGTRKQQSYRTLIRQFLSWCCNAGLIDTNPADGITLRGTPVRDVYLTDAQFSAIRKELPDMMRCFVDLCYLTGQRSQDIRMLQWAQIKDGAINFKPGKTKHSSGAKVTHQVTPAIAAVLERARAGKVLGMFVIRQANGLPYAKSSMRTAWDRACAKAGIKGVQIRDLRAKHATDAKKQGYSTQQIQRSLAHASQGTTEIYLKQHAPVVADVKLELPE